MVTQVRTQAHGHKTTSTVCRCGKAYKNLHGLKMHQARMKYLSGKQLMQRTGQVPGEEKPGPESPHSARSLHAPPGRSQARHSEQCQVKWPAVNKENEWHQFDEDMDQILQVTVIWQCCGSTLPTPMGQSCTSWWKPH